MKMAIKDFEVEVVFTVKVTIDDEKINGDFIEKFKEDFYQFDRLKDHAGHLAQMEARGLIGISNFVEGYGDLKEDVNCRVEVIGQAEYVKPLE